MWRVRGFSIQGYSHLTEGTPCQDAYRQATVGESTVLAVADGAGSRPRSAEGAAILVSVTTEVLTAMLKAPADPADARLLKRRLKEAYRRIRGQFLQQVTRLAGEDRAGEFAATLVAAVLTEGKLGIIQVGDGFVVTRTKNGHGVTGYHLISQPAVAGEYSNQAVFVTTEPPVAPVIRCAVDDGITGVLLSTDGLMPAALTREQGQPETVNTDFVERVLDHLDRDNHDPRPVVRTMLSDGVVGLTGDDLTLLTAVRAGDSG
jgi:hypothetical protein